MAARQAASLDHYEGAITANPQAPAVAAENRERSLILRRWLDRQPVITSLAFAAMHDFDNFLEPVGRQRFLTEYYGVKPLHIAATSEALNSPWFDWKRLNALLSQTAIWTPDNLKLLQNGSTVPPERYCVEVATPVGRTLRPSPAKVETYLSRGASLVANDIHTLTPEIA
ncbi:MAG TPA: hypothetical protein VF633_09790, partial [Brevundimonas sp.]